MKHQKKGRKLSRKRDQRKALLRSLAVGLILKEKIRVTEAKAKELRPFIEKIITKGKKANAGKNLAFMRSLAGILPGPAVKKVVNQISIKYKDRRGGYTRITKLNPRRTDGARMAMIEFV